MASSKPSKAERQRRNRARREARQARSAHAGEATEVARDLGGDDGGATDEAGATDAVSKRNDGSVAKRPVRRTRSGKPSPFQVPGQRAVMLAFLFSIASVGLLIFTPVRVERVDIPADDPRVEQAEDVEENDDGTVDIVEDVKLLDEESLPVSLLIMLTPVAITGAAAFFTKHEKRSTIWTFAMLAIAGYVFFLGGAYAIYTLPALVALGVGGFQARRAENAPRVAALKAQREARRRSKDSGKDVIDVDAVDED